MKCVECGKRKAVVEVLKQNLCFKCFNEAIASLLERVRKSRQSTKN